MTVHYTRPNDGPQPPRPEPRDPYNRDGQGPGHYVRGPDAPPDQVEPPRPAIRDPNDPDGPGLGEPSDISPEAPWFLPDALHSLYVDTFIETGSADMALRAVRESPLYEQYFPGNFNADSGLVAMTEMQYLAYRQEIGNLMGDYGMADHFANNEYIGRLIAGGLSLNEVEERLQFGFQAAASADPNTLRELEEFYGATASDLAAFYLDPDTATATLERRFRSAQLSGIGITSGFGDLSRGQAEGLSGMGVSDSQARQGFSSLVQQRQLFTPLMGTRGSSIGRQEQLDAVFASDADALMEIQRERSRRQAEFSGGGGAAMSQNRLHGFGSSSG